MYFLLAGVIHRFHYLKLGLSVVLVFVGLKMLLTDIYKVPIGGSLGVIALVLAVSTTGSLLWPREQADRNAGGGQDGDTSVDHERQAG